VELLEMIFLIFLEVVTETPMDLISKLNRPHSLVWCFSNKAVSLSLKRHRPSNVAAMCFRSAVPIVFGSPLTLPTYIFVVVAGYMFQFMGPVFLYFFQNFSNFLFSSEV